MQIEPIDGFRHRSRAMSGPACAPTCMVYASEAIIEQIRKDLSLEQA